MPRFLKPLLAALPLLLFLPGCKNKNYPSCKKDKDCKAELNETCVDGSCQNCKTDADCVAQSAEGQPPLACIEFRCQAPGAEGAGRPTGEEGDPCTDRSSCVGGLACKAGACAACAEDLDCSPSTCNLDTGRCASAGQCQTDDQCPIDEICDGGFCVFSGNLGNSDGGPCGLPAVFFGFDSDVLTPNTQDDLTKLAECINQQQARVFLEAHADNRGTEEYNILLTERRGSSVKNFLVDKGVPSDNLQVVPKGSLEAAGTDESSRSKDRRVQIIFAE